MRPSSTRIRGDDARGIGGPISHDGDSTAARPPNEHDGRPLTPSTMLVTRVQRLGDIGPADAPCEHLILRVLGEIQVIGTPAPPV
jgi:hypothetical protein